METPVTLVSCLFWLARTKWQHSGFPPNYDRYASWSENFLSLDAPIVIFTDDHYWDSVHEKRRKYDPDYKQTIVVKKSLSDLEFYQKYFFKMSTLMSSPKFKKIKHADCADNMYPLYNVVQYNKISLIKEVKDRNPFESSHFMWMDCGSCRDNLEKYKGKKFPTNKNYINNKVIHFTHNYDIRISERKQDYFLSQIRNIQGTSWVMPYQHVETYHQLISSELEETMAAGFIGSDEKTYDSIYTKNKELVQLVKCDWFKFYDVMSEGRDIEVPQPEPTEEVSEHIDAQPEPTEEVSENIDTQPEPTEEVSEHIDTQPEPTEEVSENVDTQPDLNTGSLCDSGLSTAEQLQVRYDDLHQTSPVVQQTECKKTWWQRITGR